MDNPIKSATPLCTPLIVHLSVLKGPLRLAAFVFGKAISRTKEEMLLLWEAGDPEELQLLQIPVDQTN